MSVRSAVLQQITATASQQKKTLAPLTDDLKLAESGMDSLCLALVVAALDDNLGLDPFDSNPPFPMTVGDFVALYENAA
jgi:hypothetical protein